ncbi:MAG: response regulator [Phycisphaerae bacterium]|nr:response regulator [Phycisphaerae bacterium]
MKILVVEDELVSRTLVQRVLEKAGDSVTAVSGGRDALIRMANSQYDVIIMDIHMPGMDGFETTAAIRRREQDGRRTPIVALTAHTVEGSCQKCFAAGMDGYIAKPVCAQTLKETIQKVLDSMQQDQRSEVT